MKIVSKTHTHDMGGGNVFKPGEVFDCSEDAARRKIEKGTAREATDEDAVAVPKEPGKTEKLIGDGEGGGATEPPTGQERADAIVEACLELDEDDKELFTSSGAPTTKALSEEAGFDVSAAERDTAWSEVCEGDGDGDGDGDAD